MPQLLVPHARLAIGLCALVAGIAACGADGPTAVPGSGDTPPTPIASGVLSQTTVGDTTVTAFVLGNDGSTATIQIGNKSKVQFPAGAASVCNPGKSTYGAGTWDDPCEAASSAITITAKTWADSSGKVGSDFEPALRFVPGVKRGVTLTLGDGNPGPGDYIAYCSGSGCVNEAVSDSSVTTQVDSPNGLASRMIKHFSGYSVVVDRSDRGR